MKVSTNNSGRVAPDEVRYKKQREAGGIRDRRRKEADKSS